MSIDVRQLAGNGFDLAKSLLPQAFATILVRLNPTVTVDIGDDSEVVVWGSETSVDALQYDYESERGEISRPEGILKQFLVKLDDLPNGVNTRTRQDAELRETDGTTWESFLVEVDPSKSIMIISARITTANPGVTETGSGWSSGFDFGFL